MDRTSLIDVSNVADERREMKPFLPDDAQVRHREFGRAPDDDVVGDPADGDDEETEADEVQDVADRTGDASLGIRRDPVDQERPDQRAAPAPTNHGSVRSSASGMRTRSPRCR